MKKVFSLLLALMLVFSLSITAFAAEGTVEYQGEKDIWIGPGSNYTDTDLFDNFKSVMPGDSLGERVTIRNAALDCDYVKVYIQAVPHDEANLPEVDGYESLEKMNAFLSQLTLNVWDDDGEEVFSGPANAGSGKVYLGTLRTWKTMRLGVHLDVPIELGNEYADYIGEVDWVFTFEAFDDPTDNPKTGDYIMMAVAVMAVSAIALIVIFAVKKRKKNDK